VKFRERERERERAFLLYLFYFIYFLLLIFGVREMGGGGYSEVLRSLCFNTVWKYAVFWKLKHRARM
jgi:hypothetical protein